MSKDTIGGRGGRGGGRGSEAQPWDTFRRPDSYKGTKGLEQAQRSAMGGASNLARAAEEAGRETYSMAAPAYGASLGFYNKLLRGGSTMQQALSPAVTKIREVGSGMTGAGGGGRNPASQMARDENKRKMMSDINTMYAGAPGAAAEALGSLGVQGQQNAASFANIAGNQWNNMGYLTNAALKDQRAADETNRSFWGNVANWGARAAAAYFTGGASETALGLVGAVGRRRGRGPQPNPYTGGTPQGGTNTPGPWSRFWAGQGAGKE